MFSSTVELCRIHEISLTPEGTALVREEGKPVSVFDRLFRDGLLADARRFLSHLLARRRALWWACLCARDAHPQLPPTVQRTLQGVERLVMEGRETDRRGLEALGMDSNEDDLARCLALAAFFSEGSISSPHAPFVAPRPFLTGRLVSVVVYLASVRKNPALYQESLGNYLSLGRQLIQGPDPWMAHAISGPMQVSEFLAVSGCGQTAPEGGV